MLQGSVVADPSPSDWKLAGLERLMGLSASGEHVKFN